MTKLRLGKTCPECLVGWGGVEGVIPEGKTDILVALPFAGGSELLAHSLSRVSSLSPGGKRREAPTFSVWK